MPQKRNPDAAELTRAKTGRILGAFSALSLVMKGLPLAYSKDMQEDKVPAFEAFDALEVALAAMTGMVADLKANPEPRWPPRPAPATPPPPTSPTGWCARLALPFRQAHHVAGQAVKRAEALGARAGRRCRSPSCRRSNLAITADVYEVLTPQASAASRTSYGGTAPDRVRAEIARWKEILR